MVVRTVVVKRQMELEILPGRASLALVIEQSEGLRPDGPRCNCAVSKHHLFFQGGGMLDRSINNVAVGGHRQNHGINSNDADVSRSRQSGVVTTETSVSVIRRPTRNAIG